MGTRRSTTTLALAALALLGAGAGVWMLLETERDGPTHDRGADAAHDAAVRELSPLESAPAELPASEEARARAAAAAAAEPGTTTAPAATAVLRGVVRDDLGLPCARFGIRARPIAANPNGFTPWEQTRSKAVESADGVFELAGLAPGPWQVRAESPAGRSAVLDVHVPAEGARVELVLPRGTRLSGRVVDPHGMPVAAASVNVSSRRDAPDCPFGTIAGQRLTCDAEGVFEAEHFPPCALELQACAPEFAASEALRVDLVPGGEHSGLRLVLRAGGRITGVALDRHGAPEVGRKVRAHNGGVGCGRGGEVATDTEGRFEFLGLSPGRIVLARMSTETDRLGSRDSPEEIRAYKDLRTATFVDLEEGEHAHVVLGGPRAPGVRLWGVVGGAARCGGPMFVNAFTWPHEAGDRSFSPVDAEGRYAIELERGGRYTLTVNTRAGTLLERDEVLPDESAVRMDFELGTAALRGHVLDGKGEPCGADVTLRPSSANALPGREVLPPRSVTTSSDGTFAFDCLPSGEYELLARCHRHADAPDPPIAPEILRRGLMLEPGVVVDGLELRFERAATLEVVVRGLEVVDDRVDLSVVDARCRAVACGFLPTRDGVLRRYVPADTLRVRVSKDKLVSAWSAPFQTMGGHTARVELMLVRGTHVSLSVRGARGAKLVVYSVLDADGCGWIGGSVARLPKEEEGSPPSTSQPLGSFPPGRYVLNAEAQPDLRRASVPFEVEGAEPVRVELAFPD